MRRVQSLAAIITVILAATANASIMELEPNDLLATATPIARPDLTFADVGLAELGGAGGDVDVFSIDLMAGDIVLANTAGLEGDPLGSDPDTIIGLVDPSGTLVLFDDDDAQSFGSNFTTEITTAGLYYIAVSGFGDGSSGDVGSAFGTAAFAGAHTEAGTYVLTVSVVGVPEPAAITMLGLAAAALACFRRRTS